MSDKIVFICTGNTCRSPMAQALAAQIFVAAGLQCQVSSAGVSAWGAQPASRHAQAVMKEGGLCLAQHKSAPVSAKMLEDATLVLTMTQTHRAILLSDYPAGEGKIFVLSEYVGEAADVADPFGGSLEEYRDCASQIKMLITRAAEILRQSRRG